MNAPITIAVDDVEAPLAPEGWCIRTEDEAAWAVDRILSVEEQIERVQRQFERNMTRLERELGRAREFFEPHLQLWYAQHPPAKGRTLHLATGDLAVRKQPGGVFIDDKEACLEWAESVLPEAIRREVVRNLDAERVKREAARMMSAAVMDALGSTPPATVDEARARADVACTVGVRALPPGVAFKPDTEVFSVKSPKGGR